jgi:hypothetical protein
MVCCVGLQVVDTLFRKMAELDGIEALEEDLDLVADVNDAVLSLEREAELHALCNCAGSKVIRLYGAVYFQDHRISKLVHEEVDSTLESIVKRGSAPTSGFWYNLTCRGSLFQSLANVADD